MTTLNETFKRPRVSLGFFAVALLVAAAAIWLVQHYWRPPRYQPPAAAQAWYDRGTDALRKGAYYQASKAFEEAIKADSKYALAHARLAEAWVELDYADRARTELLRANQLVVDRATLSPHDALYFDAISAVATPDFPRAIESYKQIVAQDSSPAAYLDLARAYERNDQIDLAIKSCLEATNRDRDYGTAFLRLGILYQRKQDPKRAASAYETADTIFQAQGNIEGRIELLLRRGSLLREQGKLAEAKTLLLQCVSLASANNSELPKINALIEMGRVAYAEGATGQAEDYAKQAIEFAEQHGLETPMVRSLIALGNAFLAKGDYDQADKNFNLGLDVAERNKSPYLQELSLANIGTLRFYQLRTDESLQISEKALAFFQAGGYRAQVMFAMITVARAKRRKGDFDGAFKISQQRLELAQQAGDQRQVAFSYGEIGNTLFERERYPEALLEYERAGADFERLGDRLNLVYSWLNRANTLWRLGRYQEASEALRQASDLANKPEGRYDPVLTEIELVKAEIALSRREFSEARTKSEFVLRANSAPFEDVPIRARYTLCQAEVFSGGRAEGQRLCENALDSATKAGDMALGSRAMLALAVAQLANGNARGALATALQTRERLVSTGQQESEWRSWIIAARASRALHDEAGAQQQFGQAKILLAQLQQSWGTEAFGRYLERPDIQALQQESGVAISAETTTPTTH